MAPAKKSTARKAGKKAAAKKATPKKATKKAAAKRTTKKAGAKKATKKAATKRTAKRSTGSSAEKPMLVSKSKVKETLKGMGKRTDGNLYDALNDELHELLEKAAKRAESNSGRSTVRPGDL